MKRLTTTILTQIGVKLSIAEIVLPSLLDAIEYGKRNNCFLTLEDYGAFVATTAHESQLFSRRVENLDYKSEKRLLEVFGKRIKKEDAKTYINSPELLANFVYANRNGNDNINDGWKYRAGGYIGTTGKKNYEKLNETLGKLYGLDFVDNPYLIRAPRFAALSAVQYWIDNELSKAKGFTAVCIKVNGGTIGLKERQELYDICIKVLK